MLSIVDIEEEIDHSSRFAKSLGFYEDAPWSFAHPEVGAAVGDDIQHDKRRSKRKEVSCVVLLPVIGLSNFSLICRRNTSPPVMRVTYVVCPSTMTADTLTSATIATMTSDLTHSTVPSTRPMTNPLLVKSHLLSLRRQWQHCQRRRMLRKARRPPLSLPLPKWVRRRCRLANALFLHAVCTLRSV